MSVYKPKNSRYFHYDFQLRGERFHGSTGQASRRSAEAVERQRRLEAGTGTLGIVGQMTLDHAAGRWWAEVGIERGDRVDVERRLLALIGIMGPKTLLTNINQSVVASAIETRKKIGRRRGKADDATVYMPKPATVNRDIVETLRPILRRAKSHWAPKGANHGLPEIDWRELRLREPRALSRIYGNDEKAAWIAACEPDVRLALECLLTYGLRFGELFFSPDQITPDTDRPTLTLQKGRKKDVLLEVPLRRDHARELIARAGRATKAKLDTVWFRQAGVHKDGTERLEAISYSSLEYWISKAADQAGVGGARRIHGSRHHAGSDILRKTKNLKAVQALLGHATINSSQRYAHVLNDDLRAALEGTEGDSSSGTIPGVEPRSEGFGPETFRSGVDGQPGQKAEKR